MTSEDEMNVPQPSQELMQQEIVCQDVAEFFSPPRVVPVARSLGLIGILSLDIVCGWDLSIDWVQHLALALVDKLEVQMLMLSPPCTAFSPLQELWNFKRMSQQKICALWSLGMVFLLFAMRAAKKQIAKGRFFMFEHPARATSWTQDCVREVASVGSVESVTFDQCMLGLVTKVMRTPTRKRTIILTNSTYLVNVLGQRQYRCDKSHVHQRIEGFEGGMKRSVFAQMYPPALVKILAEAAVDAASGP